MTWRDRAACAGCDTEAFYPPGGSAPSGIHAFALRICWERCHVRRDCLTYALNNDEDGIWGGYTRSDRAAIRDGRSHHQNQHGPNPPKTGERQ